MYALKTVPEDFIVEEIIEVTLEDGQYLYAWMKKKDYTTQKALSIISKRIHKPMKFFGFAGTKDRKAVTKQLISIKNASREQIEKIELRDISLEYFGHGKNPLLLGNLKGNKFDIIIRNIEKPPKKLKKFINYYGEQRFSSNNSEIGKSIIKKDFQKAVKLIIQNNGEYEQEVEEYIKNKPTDYVGALKKVPKEILMMLVHSYQSFLWNKMAKHYSKKTEENMDLPLIGFDTNLKDNYLKELLKEENLSPRDFIIRQIPSLTFEGHSRRLFTEIHDLRIDHLEKDELGKKKKCRISFWLEKGCYATEAIRQMLT